jgi:predicted permease
MLHAIAAILPVFLLIFLGTWFRARDFPGEDFWAPAERLTYFVLFPVLIVTTLAKADLAGLTVLPMAAAVVATLLAVAGLLVLLRRRLGVDGPGFTSLVQGAIRMNTYICLALAAALGLELLRGSVGAEIGATPAMAIAGLGVLLVLAPLRG